MRGDKSEKQILKLYWGGLCVVCLEGDCFNSNFFLIWMERILEKQSYLWLEV